MTATGAPFPAQDFLSALRAIVGGRHLLTGTRETATYRQGYRFGGGPALAVVRPANLLQLWRVAEACIAADKIIIMQAANTGLTGGSTPDGDDYGRDVVVINTMRMNKIHLIGGGKQVVCLPGATLDQLERALKPIGREPHSVIGSSCIGASVFGGICNNSGGALIRRGPVYTELSLFARVNAAGRLELVNHLGIRLDGTPEEILTRLDRQDYTDADILNDQGAASDQSYSDDVRDVDAASPARYNADPRKLHDASGSAGKVILFAARLDTFEAEKDSAVFYIGTNNPAALADLRRRMLSSSMPLPIAAEYMDADAYDIAEKYGKDTFLAIHYLGARRMPGFFRMKNFIDRYFPRGWSDRALQAASRLFPSHLPSRLQDFHRRFQHHLLLKVSQADAAVARRFLNNIDYFECTPEEGRKAFLHRFAAAGAALRYKTMHADRTGGMISLDIALRRNDREWLENLPPALSSKIERKLYYGHFFCHVFHQDYLVKKGEDPVAIEHDMLEILNARGAEYPAEHNVGHIYKAKPALAQFYRSLDPCNCLNPGIGQTSKRRDWA